MSGVEDAKISASELEKVRQDLSPERDFPPTACRLKYLVCATPRSGSTLLCSGLAATGLAGRPAEYLSAPYRRAYLQRIGADSGKGTNEYWAARGDDEYWQFLLDHRTSRNGIFGLKIHFDQMELAFPEPERMRQFLGRFDRLIFLARRDRLAQAISFRKARATGIYRVGADEEQEAVSTPPYSFRRLVHALNLVVQRETRWRLLLGDFRIKTMVVAYEDLASDYIGTMQKALSSLGVTDAVIDPKPPIVAQRDSTNVIWERLFMQDLRGGSDLRR
jgi:LPS sulfotransferase NodH